MWQVCDVLYSKMEKSYSLSGNAWHFLWSGLHQELFYRQDDFHK